MNFEKICWLSLVVLSLFTPVLNAQGFLHTQSDKIVDANGDNFLIKSIGTGNWFIQEGYMMKSAGIAGTQHEYRARMEANIGKEKTDSFYNAWLSYNMTKADIDSMKSLGFNAIRPALHYVWFTPPIEEEPVKGEITWLKKGFELVDSLLSWCSQNEMYVILDMHGTPGGQGKDSNISDYDPSKPSLWESEANQEKLIALWRKIADRYKNEPWIGGYDLINEPNWKFEEEGNAPMWDLYKRLTAAVREVDKNHMIIIEGNWFSNNYNGLPEIWDSNLVLSFHKYWNFNEEKSIQWILDLRKERNIPVWLGESGENSNTWFTNAIALCESKNIGWSWWPVKKAGINNVMQVRLNKDYEQLMNSWRGEAEPLTEEEAFQAALAFAENHKAENCIVQRDVIDAMIRQPHSYESKPFKNHKTRQVISFADYDLGRNNVAYFDVDTANHRLNTNKYIAWNQGWSYRNDGVDIKPCEDTIGNGYQVSWTEKGEWLQYTIQVDAETACSLEIRSAADSIGSTLRLEVNGEIASDKIELPVTGSHKIWETTTIENFTLPKGEVRIRFYIEEQGSDLNSFSLHKKY